uniref:DEP domain-containing protein n=1 Tax=Parascaris univalens TaxID=6257 RepID=A0A914ZU43_PARUN
MAGRVRLKAFRSGLPADANGKTNEEKHVINNKSESVFEDRFKATRLWNGIMRRFRNGMQLKRHRRQLRTYDDCFTGREAVDFLMNELPKFISENKEITRKNCALLLSKFMAHRLFSAVRGDSDVTEPFKETEIYKFSDIPVEKLASTPVLVRRAASFNERYSFGSNSTERNSFDAAATMRVQKVEFTQRNERIVPARFAIPSKMATSPLAKSRRLSSSHGNLPSMISPRMHDSMERKELERLELGYNFKEAEEESNSADEVRQTEKADALNAAISDLIEVANKPTIIQQDVRTTESIRTFGRLVQPCTPPSAEDRIFRKERQEENVAEQVNRISLRHVMRCPFTEANICDVWKDALLSRLRTMLRLNSLDGVFDFEFSGCDVKWNCEKVGKKGIVYVREEDDGLSAYLIAMMRYLAHWPFDRKFADKQYEGFELNVFENVCEHFVKGCPLLPTLLAVAILNIVSVIRARNTSSQLVVSPMSNTETRAQNNNTPSVRRGTSSTAIEEQPSSVQQMNYEMTPGTFVRASLARGSVATVQSMRHVHSQFEDGTSCSPGISSFTRSCRSIRQGNDDNMLKEYESILARLPGLHRSPELLQRVCELTTTTTLKPANTPPHRVYSISSSSLLKTPRLGLSPLVAGIAAEDESDLIWCVALVLLTISPPTRRRLHYLVRFMRRICKNHCLRLDVNRENRYVVLERLSESIIVESDLISPVQCLHIVTFLVDNENELFSVPATFKADVNERITCRRQQEVALSNERKEDTSSSSGCPRLQFCEPIELREYDEQRERGIESHLLTLLNEIVANENLSVDERKKQLKKFKKTYPQIYEKRFPSPKLRARKPRTPGILHRLRNFNFK